MAVDTREKRLAFLEFGGGYSWHTLFNPDNDIDSRDRGNLLGLYNLRSIGNLGDVRLGPTVYPGFKFFERNPVDLAATIASVSTLSGLIGGISFSASLTSTSSISGKVFTKEKLSLDDVQRLGATVFPGFRLAGEVLYFEASINSVSIINTGLDESTRLLEGNLPAISSIAPTLSILGDVELSAIVVASSLVSPSLDVTRPISVLIPSSSFVSSDFGPVRSLGTVLIASVSQIIIPLFGRKVSDLGTIRFSPLSSPGYDFFLPPRPDTLLITIVSVRSTLSLSLSITKDVDASIDSVSVISLPTIATEAVDFSAAVDSIGTWGA